MLHAIIMAGGSGTRFWPASRRACPKQFLDLTGEGTLLQQALRRCQSFIDHNAVWVVAGAGHTDLVRTQAVDLPPGNLLVEPEGRNTAPCIGLAAVRLLRDDSDARMLVMPSDHVISPPGAFRYSVEQALRCVDAAPDRLALFGVRPRRPATGYGYIERGAALTAVPDASTVVAFREKPDAHTAAAYVASGRHLWNSGLFLWNARTILDCLKRHEPQLAAALEQLLGCRKADWDRLVVSLFPLMKSISIDYAVLEREADRCVVIEAGFHWDDLGGWEAAARLAGVDEDANSVHGRVVSLDTRNCVIQSIPDHLVATLGIQDLVVVHTADATLVARRDDESGLRRLLEQLANEPDGQRWT